MCFQLFDKLGETMDWKSARVHDNGTVEVPKRWLHLHYYEALNILFRFENSLRVFVYVVLKNEQLDKWSQSSFEIAGEQKSIKGLAAKRIKQADNFGYLGVEVKSPLMHLTSGELSELITSDAYWNKFKRYFKGSKEIIKNKLLEIGTVRNSLAHFRPVKPEDLELIKQNSRHTLMAVESCLTNLYMQHVRVPTNTQSEWYKELTTVGNEFVNIIPYFSDNEEWVKVQLVFDAPVLNKQQYGNDFFSYTVGKVKPANILASNSELTKYTIYANEVVLQPTFVDGTTDVKVLKHINLVFSKKQLESSTEGVVSAIKQTCLKIHEECQLITQDNLARGELVESVFVTAWYQREGESGKWVHNYDNLRQNYEPEHPDEYWGGQMGSANDVVAGSTSYPWMQSDISLYEPPF